MPGPLQSMKFIRRWLISRAVLHVSRSITVQASPGLGQPPVTGTGLPRLGVESRICLIFKP